MPTAVASLRLTVVLAALTLAVLPVAGQDEWAWAPDVPGGYASDHVLIKVRPGFEPAWSGGRWILRPAAAAEAPGKGVVAQDPAVQRDLMAATAELGRWNAQALFAAFTELPANEATARQIGLDRHFVVQVPEGTDTPAFAEALARFSRVIEVAEVAGIGGIAGESVELPDDPDLPLQYGLHNEGQNVAGQGGIPGADIDAANAWTIATGAPGLRIGILDAGVSPHTELSGRLLEDEGWAFDGGDPGDTCGSHGTHVAGIGFANTDNATGVAGVDRQANVISFRILDGCNGYENNLAAGIIQAVNQGVDVINMSLQFGTGSTILHDAVLMAYAEDVPMLAASGNNNFSGGVAFPGRWPETITVAGTNQFDERGSFSNTGPEVDVAAPGFYIYSLLGTSSYGYKTGTSMATPMVSGVVSLMLSIDPDLTTEQIRTILCETAEDVETPGEDDLTGCGRIDAYAALLAVQDMVGVPGDANGDGLVDVADLTAIILAWGPCDGCPEDLDGDGEVGVSDLVEVILHWDV